MFSAKKSNKSKKSERQALGNLEPDPSESQQVKELKFLKHERNSKKQRPQISGKDSLGIFVLGNSIFNVLIFFILILLYGSYSRLVEKPAPSLVQLSSGDAITVAPLGSKERTEEVIKTFTVNTLTTIWNWTGYLPATSAEEALKPILDPGVEIKEGFGLSGAKKITTAAWEGSFAMSEDFRKEFLLKLVELTPADIFQGNTDVILVPINVREPIQIEPGKWKVIIIANLMVFKQGNKLGEIIPFNKEVYVRAVEAPEYSVSSQGRIAEIVARIRASGLEIYAMREFSSEDLK